jgi:hypothetical protein
VETAVLLENVTPTKKNGWVSAYQIWYRQPFDCLRLHPFGCQAFINIPKSQQDSKFDKTARKGILIGYQLGLHNSCILRDDERVELSHDVTFDKTLYPGISTFIPAGLISPPFGFD